MSWQLFMQTLGSSLIIFSGGIMLLKWLSDSTVQHLVNRAGRSNSELWYMRPGIFIHELWHAAIAVLFGIHVSKLSMRPDYRNNSAAHVDMQYNPAKWRHRVGLLFSSTAPAWGNALIMMLLTRQAFFQNNISLDWDIRQSVATNQIAPLFRGLQDITINWPWLAALLLVGLVLTPGFSPSTQDLKNALSGLPWLLAALAGIFVLSGWVFRSWLWVWMRLNIDMAITFVVILVFSLLMNLLSRKLL
ncbi:hypothetical protein [Lacticaseibacillus saniviri]